MGKPLAVTLGEPAGIGPDITLEAWRRRKELDLPAFYVLGDPDFLTARAARLGLAAPMARVMPDEAAAAFGAALPVVDLGIRIATEPGKPDRDGALLAIAAIERGARDALDGRSGALVTNPIAKSVLYAHGFTAPGHTEYLARFCAERTGQSTRAVMLLWSEELAVVPVTIHVPLGEVPRQLTTDLIEETALIVEREMRTRFSVERPRLAVSGLNPHAGESGTIGGEEAAVIAPALERLRARGLDVKGPLAADSMFHPKARAAYDVALTMFHDQALIPIKTIAFDRAVNVTLGLPLVRTSPDHGTAFDIAGTGRASASSLVAALRLAARLARVPAPLGVAR